MIIPSILYNDFYTFTVGQCFFNQGIHANVVSEFDTRTEGIDYSPVFEIILEKLKALEDLFLTKREYDYLANLKSKSGVNFFKSGYLAFLKNFRFTMDNIDIRLNDDGSLYFRTKGISFEEIMYEVPCLAIINAVYCEYIYKESYDKTIGDGLSKIVMKADVIKHANAKGFKFADFGTRRAFSPKMQEIMIAYFIKEIPEHFIGTSNTYYAMKYRISPIGTQNHKFYMVMQGLDNVRLSYAQKKAFEVWTNEYRGELGIALTDTYGVRAFLKDFDSYYARLFDGLRHDSGSPVEWAKLVIEHLEKMNIDPMTKTLVFSDGLTIHKALQLYDTFHDKVNLSFGIGTHLTNDVGGEALSIVMKAILVNDRPVAKLSDNEAKVKCIDQDFLDYIKSKNAFDYVPL